MLPYWFMLVLAAFAVLAPANSEDCEDDNYARSADGMSCGYYYSLLENALVNGSDNLYNLQRAFFPAVTEDLRGVSTMLVDLTFMVDVVGNESCGLDIGQPTFSEWPYEGSVRCTSDCHYGILLTWQRPGSNLVSIANDVALTAERFEGLVQLHSLLYPMSTTLAPWPDASVSLDLHLDHLGCNPDVKRTDDLLTYLTSWLKNYAIAQKRPEMWDESDRGHVIPVKDDFQNGYHYISVHVLTLSAFVLVNISVILFMVRVTPQVYSTFVKKVSNEVIEVRLKYLYCILYWGGSTVLFFLVIILFLCDVLALAISAIELNDDFYFSSKHTEKVVTRTVGTVSAVKALAIIVEMTVCVVTCKRIRKGIDLPFRCFGCVYCCCCCCCRCCSVRVKHKAIQAVALWSIMSFVQHLAMSAIPIFFFVIVSPAETLSILALCISALFCIIMLVTHVLYMCQVSGSKNGRQTLSVAVFLVQILLIVCVLSTIIVIILLYLTMVSHGAKFNFGIFSVSLIPSAILSLMGWFVKRKLQQSFSRTPENDGYEDLDSPPSNEETMPLHES